MKTKFTNLVAGVAAVVVIGAFSHVTLADDAEAASTIAGVLNSLNHFPSDEDKAAMQAIVDDESVSEGLKSVAMAVANIEHSATDADKEALNGVIGSDEVGDEARALAEIVVGINHMASDEAKEALQAML